MTKRIVKLLGNEISVRRITLPSVIAFMKSQKRDGTKYTEDLLDVKSITNLLTDRELKQGRELWGLFQNTTVIGYAVVYRPENTLDLLYIDPDNRGYGYSSTFIKKLVVTNVVVNRYNLTAINLYTKLGLKITYDDE